jgi:hypothetical protein
MKTLIHYKIIQLRIKHWSHSWILLLFIIPKLNPQLQCHSWCGSTVEPIF